MLPKRLGKQDARVQHKIEAMINSPNRTVKRSTLMTKQKK